MHKHAKAVFCLFTAINILYAVSINDFATGSVTYQGSTVVYRLFTPAKVAGQKYPFVLALHGAGEIGNNNTSQLNLGFMNLVMESEQAARPAFVLAPQCPSNFVWVNGGWSTGVYVQSGVTGPLATVKHLFDSLITVLPVDTNRLYVTGLSMGGMATWDLITRYPTQFAAAVPVCGAVDTTKLAPLATLPIWTYHGTADSDVPPLGTRTAIRKFAAMGQTILFPLCGTLAPSNCQNNTPAMQLLALPTVKKIFTELAGYGHNVWGYAYADTMMYRWMFLQTKLKVTITAPIGGEKWSVASKRNITWTVTDNAGGVHVSLYWRTTSASWIKIDSVSAGSGNGSYLWTVPPQSAAVAWIKVNAYDVSGNKRSDTSDSPFSIVSKPAFTSIDSVTVFKGENLNYAITANNTLGGSPVYMAVAGNPAWMSISGGTNISGTAPNVTRIDTFKVSLSVGGVSYDTLTLRVFITASPSILPIANIPKPFEFKINGQNIVASIDRPGILKCKIYDISGALVKNLKLNVEAGNCLIPFHSKTGIYLITLKNNGRKLEKKFFAMETNHN
jgi:dienelactone hydrolase